MEIENKNGKYYKKRSFSLLEIIGLISLFVYGVGLLLYLYIIGV